MNHIDTDTAHRLWSTWLETSIHRAELLNPCDLIRMVEDELEKHNKRNIVLVKNMFVADRGDTLWIGETIGGEGGEFSKDKFHEVLRNFYDKEF